MTPTNLSSSGSPGSPANQTQFDKEFLAQYLKDDGTDALTASAETIRGATLLLTSALVRSLLPGLDDTLRAVMRGQITPAHRELMIALVQLLTDEKDIADELGFGPQVFQDILDKDIEVETLGGELGRVVTVTDSAETVQNGALWVMNGDALLAVRTAADAQDDTVPNEKLDAVVRIFSAAMQEQERLLTAPARTAAPTDPAAPPTTLKGLREHVAQVAADAGVRQAVATIQLAGDKARAAGTPVEELLPQGAARPAGGEKANKSSGGKKAGVTIH